jgi:hypothetical protein
LTSNCGQRCDFRNHQFPTLLLTPIVEQVSGPKEFYNMKQWLILALHNSRDKDVLNVATAVRN